VVLPTTSLYQLVLRQPHERRARIEITDIDGIPRVVVLNNVPQSSAVGFTSGEVRATLTNRVTRTAQFTLPAEFYPVTADDALSPEFAVAHIYAGVGYGDGTEEMFPVFTGRIQDATREDNGSVTFQCDDLATDVIEYRFEQPRTTQAAMTLAEIRSLILEALPQATFGTDTVVDQATPKLTWDEDRGQALDDLANSLGGRWYALGNGDFVVRPFNYELGPAVQELLDGPGGLMVGANTSRSRAGAANSIVVVSERTDGSAPVRVPTRDISPSSPTFFGGKFGRVSQIIKVQTPLTTTQAQVLGQTQLAASKALTEQWSAAIVPDHSLEPGDTVDLRHRGLTATQVIDTITYPLDTTTPMAITTRAGTT
jgi:hypothetical protein